MDKREFLKLSSLAATAMMLSPYMSCSNNPGNPAYLQGYGDLYAENPHAASLKWFRDAKFGLFIHYGLYSLLGRGEWVQIKEQIRVKEYEKLKDKFTAENFDADFITDLALEAEMKYVNITTRHHDSFCLWNTKTTNFNSVNSPAKRDLVEELANACAKKGLGLCLYFSHGRDWRHPHAPNNDRWGSFARPKYDPEETYYKYGEEHDLNIYLDYMHAQLKELLTNYGPIASIWLDGHGVPMNGPTEEFKIQETYDLIRKLQPASLISAKWGYNGKEDYFAPEYHWLKNEPEQTKKMVNSGKPIEICTHIAGWGYDKSKDGKHRGKDSIIENLEYAGDYNANLLLNIAPKPDGTIDKQDIATLKAVGEHIRKNGFPKS
ncbi:alpha-L-fucosidase [Gramella sp. AN32]|uniref:alpha-L-fucosidase n=1 Tax=Christiangramia antarctica TaxID=2058158 RepID=A0ABW5X5I7_9FLAO|nr:alpha-L-fucosidase [Gramella sp. AN32]MCM4155791.1 alpha-L-fucosidase precursor [Gramella sp. AN32]